MGKKFLILIALLVSMHFKAFSQVLAATYYISSLDNAVGYVPPTILYGTYVRIKVPPTTSPTNAVIWDQESYGWYIGPQQSFFNHNTFTTLYSMLDADGVNIDYLFWGSSYINGSPIPQTKFQGAGSNCISNQYYFSNQSVTPPTIPLDICYDVPKPLTSCIQEDPSDPSKVVVTLVCDPFFAIMNSKLSPAPGQADLYLFYGAGPSSTAYPSTSLTYPLTGPTTDADGVNYDYTFYIPKSAFSGGWIPDACYDFYYYNDVSYADPVLGTITDPRNFAGTTTVCPCCAGSEHKLSYTINTVSPNNVDFTSNAAANTWNYGDGNIDYGYEINQSHSYGSSGSYVVNTISSACNNHTNICVPTIFRYKIFSPTTTVPSPDPCTNVDFTARFDNLGNVVVSSDAYLLPDPNIYPGATSQAANFIWSGGVTPYSSPTGNSYPSELTLPFTSATTNTSISLNYYFTLPGTFFTPSQTFECVVEMNDACVALKQVSNNTAVNSITQTIDKVEIAPNPATDVFSLTFTLYNEDNINVTIVDATGRIVASALKQHMSSGIHNIELSTAELTSGLYSVSIQTNKGIIMKKLSIIK